MKQSQNIIDNKPVIGLTCSYIPEEILVAAKAVPFRIYGNTDPPELSTSYLPANFCPYVLSCLDCGLKKEYNSLDGIIIANSCNAMRRLYDVWRHSVDTKFVYMLDIPKSKDKKAEIYFGHCLSKMVEAIEHNFRIKIKDEDLNDAIIICNETRELLNELNKIKQNCNISIPAKEIYSFFQESKTLPKDEANKKLRNFVNNLRINSATAGNLNSKVKILITGSFHNPTDLITHIEQSGGKVMFEDVCTSGRYLSGKIETSNAPLESIAHFYINKSPCARMVNAEDRFNYILKLVKDYKIDGIVYYALKFCDTHLLDLPFLRERLSKVNIPLLFLEGDSLQPASGQIKTRIKAFLEMFNCKQAE